MKENTTKNLILTLSTPIILISTIIVLTLLSSNILSIKNTTPDEPTQEIEIQSTNYNPVRSVKINPDNYKPACLDENDDNSSYNFDTDCFETSNETDMLIPSVEEIMHSSSYTLCGSDAIEGLSSVLVTETGGFGFHYGNDTIRVFGEERSDFFSIATTGQLNIWCNDVMSGCFNCSNIDTLSFTLGLEDGTSNSAYVRFYTDDNLDYPVQEVELQPGSIPKQYTIDLHNVSALKIEVANMASCESNRAIFYDVTIAKD